MNKPDNTESSLVQPDERQAFEAWAIKDGFAYRHDRLGFCYYDKRHDPAWIAWTAWTGRASIAAAPAVEGAAQEADARRYRWLRDASPERVEVYFATDRNASGWGAWNSWSDKDAGIDAAMAQEPK